MRAEKIRILFLAICLVSAIIIFGCKKQGNSSSVSEAKSDTAKKTFQANHNSIASDATASLDKNENDTTVIAYYFHRTVRCSTCLAIEALARETIEGRFKDSIDKGTLIWLPVNMEEAGSEEFVKKFELDAPTLVVAEVGDGEHVRWKKLEKVWQLLEDPDGFSRYVTEEINEYLQ